MRDTGNAELNQKLIEFSLSIAARVREEVAKDPTWLTRNFGKELTEKERSQLSTHEGLIIALATSFTYGELDPAAVWEASRVSALAAASSKAGYNLMNVLSVNPYEPSGQ